MTYTWRTQSAPRLREPLERLYGPADESVSSDADDREAARRTLERKQPKEWDEFDWWKSQYDGRAS